jgi:adenine-specific DNA methylase
MGTTMNAPVKLPPVTPFSLKDTPSLIERVWPAQKISVETQRERKANLGQTLTGLGSFWKGRKPLFLVRACILGALLPATDDVEKDLEIFEKLCGIDPAQIATRLRFPPTLQHVLEYGAPAQVAALTEEVDGKPSFRKLPKDVRLPLFASVLARMPFALLAEHLFRPEEIVESSLTDPVIADANRHLGTTATDLADLIHQLGVARFGRRPKVGDVFCGGGSIPFEAARLGCEAFGSDLNPLACLLTWGALNVIGAAPERRTALEKAQVDLVQSVDRDIVELGIEHDAEGNRAKAYLYCVEATCPRTGWSVPLSPSWVVSRSKRVIAVLVPDHERQRYDIEVRVATDEAELEAATKGTIHSGRMIHFVDGEEHTTAIKSLRGDRRSPSGDTVSDLRLWEKLDFEPRDSDLFRERLYAIQWISKATLGKPRLETFFSGVGPADLDRERIVREHVRANLALWQSEGLIPDMRIEAGENTTQPIREKGWTHWHHLFTPRDYIIIASVMRHNREPEIAVLIPSLLNHASKLCQWITSSARHDDQGSQVGGARDLPNHVFYNQALNTFWNYASRASTFLLRDLLVTKEVPSMALAGSGEVRNQQARDVADVCDLFITDPPYADAVHYHEISEYFIAWMRKRAPEPFDQWVWDSRRPLAIKGDGEDFRDNMVAAYKAMADHMPDNGLQIVMFTHQDAGVWADMAQIFWGAGLRVMAAWYIATETTSELKKGGYVQGTVILVLRKRLEAERGYKDEIVQEVKAEVAHQIDTMVGLNQTLRGHGRVENLFEDADLQMAGYAAALRVLTRYAVIDGVDMTKEALRSRKKGESGVVGEIIEFAVQVANEHLVPEGLEPRLWDKLNGAERFFMRMLDVETSGAKKLDNYQNFAKAFRVGKDWQRDLMGSLKPNEARLKSAVEFRKSIFDGDFGTSRTRAVLYALHEIQAEVDGDLVLSHLRELVPTYLADRDDLSAIAAYIALKKSGVDAAEASAARVLQGLLRNERLG